MSSPRPPSPKRLRPTNQLPPTMIILVGLPGSGKSTFASSLIDRSSQKWIRINQDTINKGKRGTRDQCIASTKAALAQGTHVLIDRTNITPEQRKFFIDVATSAGCGPANIHCVFFNFPVKECGYRAAQRQGHEGGVQGPRSYATVGMMQKELITSGPPALREGFASLIECRNNEEIDAAVDVWSRYGSDDMNIAEEWEKVKPKKKQGSSGGGGSGGLQRLDKFFVKKKGEDVGAGPSKFTPAGSQQKSKEETRNKVATAAATTAAAGPSKPAGDGSNAFSMMMAASKHQSTSATAASPKKPSQHAQQQQQSSTRHTFRNHGALLALNRYLKDPETLVAKGEALYCDSKCVVVRDMYPKAHFHILVLARDPRWQGPLDLVGGDAAMVRHMKEIGLQMADTHASEDEKAFGFALGFHSVPSMRLLHLHVISKDYDSVCLKHKKHWNSFTTEFFQPADSLLEQLEGLSATEHYDYDIDEKEALLKGPMRCPKCRVELRNMPAVKEHVGICTGRK